MGEFQGWSNWETWLLFTYIRDEETTYEAARVAAAGGEDIFRDFAEAYVYSACVDEDGGFAVDVVGAALDTIDWMELHRTLTT